MNGRKARLLMVVVVLAAGPGWAWSQGGPESGRPAGRGRVREPGATQPGGPAWRGLHSRPLGPGMRLGARLFQPAPEDRGPLQPGEDESLLAFAKERLPQMYELMTSVRERNPERFRAALEEHAPRLRHLQRIYALSPTLGDAIRAHAANLVEIQRRVRGRHRGGSPPEEVLTEVRPLVRRNVELESEALAALADELEQQLETRIAERMADLLSEDTGLAEEPEALRQLVESYRGADEPERVRLRGRLRELVDRHIRLEIEKLRTRSVGLREHVDEETEQRMQRVIERGPGWRRGG